MGGTAVWLRLVTTVALLFVGAPAAVAAPAVDAAAMTAATDAAVATDTTATTTTPPATVMGVAATPQGDLLAQLHRQGAAVGCADVVWAAAQGLIGPGEVVELAALGLDCPNTRYVVMLAMAAGGTLTCTDVSWHADRAVIDPDQATSLRAAMAARGTTCVDTGPVATTFGTSVDGRPLVAWRRQGGPTPTRRVLAVGVIHGEEPAGRAITDLLMTLPLPTDLELWIVPTLNPDGEAVGRRTNSHGVDLNRNFPTGWLAPGTDPLTSGGYDSGPGPASEPETQAVMALVRAIGPQLTLWYHQPWGAVVCGDTAAAGCGGYAARVGLPLLDAPRPGSSIGWQAAEGLGLGLVVELVDGPAPADVVERHALAVLAS